MFFHAEGELGISEEDLGGYKVSEDCEVTLGEGDTKVSELLDKVNSIIYSTRNWSLFEY